jgi:hypothetical protein
VRDYRPDWDLEVKEPVAGNYYPVSLSPHSWFMLFGTLEMNDLNEELGLLAAWRRISYSWAAFFLHIPVVLRYLEKWAVKLKFTILLFKFLNDYAVSFYVWLWRLLIVDLCFGALKC